MKISRQERLKQWQAHQKRMAAPAACRHWGFSDVAELRRLAEAGESAAAIAKALNRSKSAIGRAARRRGILIGATLVAVTKRATFAELMAGRRYDDDPRSARPQPLVTFHRPATFVAQKGSLAG